ncbi:unnamed protein product, partial [Amoebophrya sp. A120]
YVQTELPPPGVETEKAAKLVNKFWKWRDWDPKLFSSTPDALKLLKQTVKDLVASSDFAQLFKNKDGTKKDGDVDSTTVEISKREEQNKVSLTASKGTSKEKPPTVEQKGKTAVVDTMKELKDLRREKQEETLRSFMQNLDVAAMSKKGYTIELCSPERYQQVVSSWKLQDQASTSIATAKNACEKEKIDDNGSNAGDNTTSAATKTAASSSSRSSCKNTDRRTTTGTAGGADHEIVAAEETGGRGSGGVGEVEGVEQQGVKTCSSTKRKPEKASLKEKDFYARMFARDKQKKEEKQQEQEQHQQT